MRLPVMRNHHRIGRLLEALEAPTARDRQRRLDASAELHAVGTHIGPPDEADLAFMEAAQGCWYDP